MKDKIIEILTKTYNSNGMLCPPDFDEIADEILALTKTDKLAFIERWQDEWLRGQDDRLEIYCTDGSVEKSKYTVGIDWAYSPPFVTAVSDCTCRHCHPEHWILDARNIWIRKIGSLGDEVI